MQLDHEGDDVEAERPQVEDVLPELAIVHQLGFRQLGGEHLRRRHGGQRPLRVVLGSGDFAPGRREVP